MSGSVRKATLTVDLTFPLEERPTLDKYTVFGLLLSWHRGQAVDSSLSWHWFPLSATAHGGRDLVIQTWRGRELAPDGAAPQWVRDAVAAYRPEEDKP